MREAAYSLGIVLFSILAFVVFFVFSLNAAIVMIIAVNLVFIALTALSFTSRWPARWRS